MLAHAGAFGGWSAWFWPVCAGAAPAFLYLSGLRRLRNLRSRPWSPWRTAAFISGCVALSLSLSPVVDGPAAAHLSGHMVQHLLLGSLAPLGTALGAPITLLLGCSAPPVRLRIRRLLASPWTGALTTLPIVTLLYAGGPYLLYLTSLYEVSTRSSAVHHLVHVHFLLAGHLFVWTVAGADPSPRRASMLGRITALVVASGSHAFLAKFLYARAATLPPGAGLPSAGVEAAAQWMYYGGHLGELAILVVLFSTWYRKAPRLRPAKEALAAS